MTDKPVNGTNHNTHVTAQGGARMPAELHIEPTLFMYDGTSAGKVGMYLKQLFKESYGADLPILQHLWIDTDSNPDSEVLRWYKAEERSLLAGFNADAVLANLNNYPTIKSFWPRGSRLRPGFVKDGAGQIRLQGRLALHRMFADRTNGPALIDRLRAATDALQQISNYDAVEAMSNEQMRFIVERNSVRVVIVNTLCGGTGSGVTWDVAYLVRQLLKGRNPTIIHVGVLPPVVDTALKNEIQVQREKIRANAYAWLKEHEYLLEHPHWRQAYPEGAPLNIQAPPFNLRFLVDIANQAGDRLNSDDDVYRMIALALFLDTGSSIAGAIRGFTANTGVLLEEFHGRRRAYSSLAAASLIFPVEKISAYCGAKLGMEMVQQGMLAQPDGQEVTQATAALLSRLELKDTRLLDILLDEHRIANNNAPAIRKSDDVEKIRKLLATQEQTNERDRRHLEKRITEEGKALGQKLLTSLDSELASLAQAKGFPFARTVIGQLLMLPAVDGFIPEDTNSLLGLRQRLVQQGVSEADLREEEEKYRQAREKLRSLEGGFLKGMRKKVRGKVWKKDLDRYRNDALQAMDEANRISLQLAAQRAADDIYNQLIERVQMLKDDLALAERTALRALDNLEQSAQERLEPATSRDGVFEMVIEAVDAEYIQAYYHRHSRNLSPLDIYRSYTATQSIGKVADLRQWKEDDLAQQIQKHAAEVFRAELEQTSLLEALAEHYGDDTLQKVESLLDRLVRYTHPFWQYDADSGINGQEGKSIMGVEDEHSPLIPPKYRDNIQYELKSTGFRHRIDVARVQHGLPAFLLRGMDEYKVYYDMKRKGIDPLHVIPDVADFREVIPDERQEAREIFAVAAAFDYIVQIGAWYYFDPKKEYLANKIHPGRSQRLAQGREKAEGEFVQNDEFVQMAERLVERDIESMGNQAAIARLQERIQSHRQALSKMPIDNELRRQYRKEIEALEAKQRQLGLISPEDMLMAA